VQFVFHRIDLETPVYGFAPEEFASFLGWLAARDGYAARVALTRDVVHAAGGRAAAGYLDPERAKELRDRLRALAEARAEAAHSARSYRVS
jgi:hypothetical protein